MKIRKLPPMESARLCSCGLFPDETGHSHTCRCWKEREIARLRAQIAALEQRIARLVTPAAARRPIPPIREASRWWTCADCGRNIHARSVRDPDRCIRCATFNANGGRA
jgi:hypothetical protein